MAYTSTKQYRFFVRLGRLTHWTMTTIAILFFILTPVAMLDSKLQAESSERDHAIWEKDNPPGRVLPNGKISFLFKLKNGDFLEIEVPEFYTREDALGFLISEGNDVIFTEEPIVFKHNYQEYIFLLFVGLLFFIIGRMTRYLISAE